MAIQPSTNAFLAQNTSQGGWWHDYFSHVGTGTKTAALTTCGSLTSMRFPDPFVITSSMGSNGLIITNLEMFGLAADGLGAFLEVEMGTITMATGVFTDGSAMPSRRIVGKTSTTQMAAPLVMLVADTTNTATTPTITITYVNQAGTGSRSAALTLPTSSVATSAYVVNPHFQAGDTGIQDVTNITKSAGTAGTMKVFGLYPIMVGVSGASESMQPDLWSTSIPEIVLAAGDKIGFYCFGSSTANSYVYANMYGIGDSP